MLAKRICLKSASNAAAAAALFVAAGVQLESAKVRFWLPTAVAFAGSVSPS